VDGTTGVEKEWLVYVDTAILHTVRQTMSTMSGSTFHPPKTKILIEDNDLEGLKSISQHPIVNAFYCGICLGGNPRGIRGMTPGEPLQVLESSLFKIVIEGLCVNPGYKPKPQSYLKILQELDVWARCVGKCLGQQSDWNLPSTYFPNGVTGGTKLAGHKMPGVLLVLLMLCKMKETITLLLTSKYFQAPHYVVGSSYWKGFFFGDGGSSYPLFLLLRFVLLNMQPGPYSNSFVVL
jgi:hypothetical protein